MLSNQVRTIAQQIGQFYLQRNNGDYEKTKEDITKLRISKIEAEEDKISITLERVGLLIGKRGQTIEALEKFLGTKVLIFEDKDPLMSWLIPYPEPTEEELEQEMMWEELWLSDWTNESEEYYDSRGPINEIQD